MARKLKSYQTSQGFFDLAIAAPSMKAALEAWGSNQNLFHLGLAKETDDPAIIAATMDKPGVVLKRPVGSSGVFKEHAELPSSLPITRAKQAKPKTKKQEKPKPKRQEKPARGIDDAAARQAAVKFERQQKQREDERHKQDAVLKKAREQRARAVDQARVAFEKAKTNHEAAIKEIEADREKLEQRFAAEELRWTKEKKRLNTQLRLVR